MLEFSLRLRCRAVWQCVQPASPTKHHSFNPSMSFVILRGADLDALHVLTRSLCFAKSEDEISISVNSSDLVEFRLCMVRLSLKTALHRTALGGCHVFEGESWCLLCKTWMVVVFCLGAVSMRPGNSRWYPLLRSTYSYQWYWVLTNFLRSKECFKNNEVYLDCESKAFELTFTLIYCIFVLLFKPTVFFTEMCILICFEAFFT